MRTRSRLVSLCLAGLLAATLAGCGFHLRGAAEVPPELSPVYIQADPGSRVSSALQGFLAMSKVQLAPNPAEARLIVRILGESRSSRVAAVDRNGKVIAEELHLRVRFDVLGPDRTQRLEPQSLDLVRTYENPDVEVLGKQQEAELIYADLSEDAADRILMRLRAALN